MYVPQEWAYFVNLDLKNVNFHHTQLIKKYILPFEREENDYHSEIAEEAATSVLRGH